MLKVFYQDRLEKLIADLKAFEELKTPKISTAGMPLFYYIAIERLLDDNGEWQKFGDNSKLMLQHSQKCLKNSAFNEVCQILVEFANKFCSKKHIVAGYQRRDWPFSGAYACLSGKKHFSFYKDQTIELLKFDKENDNKIDKIENFTKNQLADQKLLFVGDLLNVGSTALNGWMPIIKTYKAQCKDVVYIFSRNQGGEKNLLKNGVKAHSLIKLGAKFLARHCKNKNFCTAYWKNPIATSTMYIRKNGALDFLHYFNPNLEKAKQPRVYSFYINWLDRNLTKHQKLIFQDAVKKEFNVQLSDLINKFKINSKKNNSKN